jgi:hypothetical protein
MIFPVFGHRIRRRLSHPGYHHRCSKASTVAAATRLTSGIPSSGRVIVASYRYPGRQRVPFLRCNPRSSSEKSDRFELPDRAHARSRRFPRSGTDGSQTRCWRRQSRANPSLKVGLTDKERFQGVL